MRYQNAAELLPAELLEALQGYLDGGYPVSYTHLTLPTIA